MKNNKERKAEKPESGADAIALKIAAANHFDIPSLESNRRGRLSGSQVVNALQVIGIFLVMTAGAVYLFINIAAGGELINAGQFRQAFLPCGSSLVVLIAIGGIYVLGEKVGIERYMAKSPLDLLRKILVAVDLLLGKVEQLEGMAARSTEIETSTHRKDDGFTETRKTTRYFYKVEGILFRVSEGGYSAFPPKAQKCRLYYLPSSLTIVNLEVL